MKRETVIFWLSFLMLAAALYLFYQVKGPALVPSSVEELLEPGGSQETAEPEETISPVDTPTDANTTSKGKSLDLSDRNLDKVPSYVFGMTSLEELDLSHNALTGAIPSQIGQLSDLKVLDASDNQMTGVPAEVGRLSKLEVLDLSHNQLTGLPNELGNLKNLKTLDLSGNAYSEQDLAGIRAKLPSTNFILQ